VHRSKSGGIGVGTRRHDPLNPVPEPAPKPEPEEKTERKPG
jgi:hypothetical protein